MKELDFTKETSKLADKLLKLGFRYQSTDQEEPDDPLKPSRRITTWANVMNGVTLKIIDTYGIRYDENNALLTTERKYVRITDVYTDTGVSMSVEEFMELEEITNSPRQHIPTPGNTLRKNYQLELGGHAE